MFETIFPIDYKLENCFHIIKTMNAIDFRSSAKAKMAAIKLFNMYAIGTPYERDIFRIISPINFKFDL